MAYIPSNSISSSRSYSPAKPEDSKVVERFYGSKEDPGRHARKESPIFHLRVYNNWIKSCLVADYCSRGDVVLDLGCGKGGDFFKFNKKKVCHWFGADLARGSIEHAVERYNELKEKYFKATFIAADCSKEQLSQCYPSDLMFDFVNCQFCLHYFFETEEKIHNLLKNVSERLRPGGYFVGTVPDAHLLVKRVREAEGLEFSNSVFIVKFDQKKSFPLFGSRYLFKLDDAVDLIPEYLVHFESFAKLAFQYDLQLERADRFHEFIEKELKRDEDEGEEEGKKDSKKQLLIDMHREAPRSISQDEWEALGLYRVFVFKKLGEKEVKSASKEVLHTRTVDSSEIIDFYTKQNLH